MSKRNDFKICRLTTKFYQKAKEKNLVEIMEKEKRPYLILILTIKNIDFAIPFRTHIKHNYCFKTIQHSDEEWSGLDYTKSVIITENDIDNKISHIKPFEFSLIKQNIGKIKTEFKKYVEGYITTKKLNKELTEKYKFSTLQNYHKELNISE